MAECDEGLRQNQDLKQTTLMHSELFVAASQSLIQLWVRLLTALLRKERSVFLCGKKKKAMGFEVPKQRCILNSSSSVECNPAVSDGDTREMRWMSNWNALSLGTCVSLALCATGASCLGVCAVKPISSKSFPLGIEFRDHRRKRSEAKCKVNEGVCGV